MPYSKYLTCAYLIYFAILWNAGSFGFLKYDEPSFAEVKVLNSEKVRALEDGVLKDRSQEVDLLIIRLDLIIRLQLSEKQAVSYGDLLEINARCKHPTVTPQFDQVKYLQKDGVVAVCNGNILGTEGKDGSIIMSRIWSLKRALRKSMAESVSEPYSSFLTALIIGGAEQIPQAVSDDFRAAGTSHILAISGFNISLLIALVTGLFGSLVMRKIYRCAAVFALILFFVLLVGLEPSVVRAALMGSLGILATLFERAVNRRNVLLLSAVIMTAQNPFILRYDIGFQLSFAATLGMLYGAQFIEGPLQKYIPWKSMTEHLIPTLAAVIFTIPIQAYYFGTISLAAIPANLFLLPLVTTAMAVSFATMLAGLIHPATKVLFGPLAWLIAGSMISIAHFFASLSWAQKKIPFPGEAVCVYYGILSAIIYSRYRYVLFRRKSARDDSLLPAHPAIALR